MKTLKNTLFSLGLVTALLSCASSGDKKESDQSSEPALAEVAQADAQTGALDNYMTLKDALVKTDAANAKTAASLLEKSLKAENMDAKMIEAANTIASTDDIKAQRTAFKTITDGLIASLKANESEDGVFVQYCPMAFNNSGASWLSMSEEIRNPYFGDMMLKCGKVEEKL